MRVRRFVVAILRCRRRFVHYLIDYHELLRMQCCPTVAAAAAAAAAAATAAAAAAVAVAAATAAAAAAYA